MSRGKSVQYAVVTAIFSKFSSTFLQVLSLPLAARELEIEKFGVYSIVSLSLFILSMLQLGVGPALSRMIAKAYAKGDRTEERHAFLSGLILTGAIVITGVISLSILVSSVPMTLLFGDKFAGFEDTLRLALQMGILFAGCEIILWHTDRTLEGYLEAHINHATLSVSNLIGAAVIFFGISHFPNIPFLLIATFVPKIVSRFYSTYVLFKRHPYLLRGWTTFRKSTFKTLMLDGLSFSATGNLVYLLEVFVCGLLVGRFLGPSDVAVYQIFATISTIFSGLILMVAKPYWTAAVNATEQNDHSWVTNATRKLLLYYGLLTGCAGFCLLTIGPWVIRMLYGEEFVLPRLLFLAHFSFLALVGWRDIGLYIMVGMGRLGKTVFPIVCGLLISLSIGIYGLMEHGVAGMFFGLAIGIAALPAWRLGLYVSDLFRTNLPQTATVTQS